MQYDINNIRKLTDEVFGDAVALRRTLHRHPELSEEEKNTMALIARELEAEGIPFETNVGGYGVSAVIYGKDRSRGIAVRADIDALPIEERTGLPFASENPGVMHACGHDMHAAILLGTAKVLNRIKGSLSQSVRLLFQPAEETCGAADKMIKSGCLASPKISSVLAVHVDPFTPVGAIKLEPGVMNAACSEFTVTVKGKTCHGAHPTQGIDALLPACAMVTSLQSVITRRMDPVDPILISIGTFNSGTKENVISGEAIFTGTIRALDMKNMKALKTYIAQMCTSIAAAYGARCETEFSAGYPTLKNDDGLLDMVEEVSRELLGEENALRDEKPSLGADDFAFFCHAARGLYYHVGTRRPGDEDPAPIHSEHFDPDEEAIRVGILTEAASVLRIMEE